jgi:hypothetical protein
MSKINTTTPRGEEDMLKKTRDRIERIKETRCIDDELLTHIAYINQEIARSRRYDLLPIKRY